MLGEIMTVGIFVAVIMLIFNYIPAFILSSSPLFTLFVIILAGGVLYLIIRGFFND